MAAARQLVVVASADPATTDALADSLRDSCTVRTAYDAPDLLDRLDEEVDAVVLDADLGAGAVDAVTDAVAERGLPCQVGLLTDASESEGDRTDAPAAVDAVVARSAREEDLGDAVTWLATRARYRRTLEEYYQLARRVAEAEAGPDCDGSGPESERSLDGKGGDPDGESVGPADDCRDPDDARADCEDGNSAATVRDRREALARRRRELDRLRDALDDTAHGLDVATLFEATLDVRDRE